MAEVTEVIAPVWPLKDYVAVNPYAGISQRPFMDARAFMKVFSDCETLMPTEHYAHQFHQGHFTPGDIERAIAELSAAGISQDLSAEEIADQLTALGFAGTRSSKPAATPNHGRPIRTIAECVTAHSDIDWTEAIVDEVSKHCAAHYDQGQATWSSPHKDLSLYQAWRTTAEHDRNIEILGLRGFRKYVARLPHTAEAAIVYLLQELNVPQPLWSAFLLCQAFSIPGWSAWAKYRTAWTDAASVEHNDLTGLLAIRLAYDAALSEAEALNLNWTSLVENESASFKSPEFPLGDDSILRYTLLRASEIGYRNHLLKSLSLSDEEGDNTAGDRKLAQMVFCIDVRSERIRRQLESLTSDIETFGFAGFFGMAFEYVTIGAATGNRHLPVLLKPQFKLYEGLHESDAPHEAKAISNRNQDRVWKKLWKRFQASAVGCFSFVETMGIFSGLDLLRRTIGSDPRSTGAHV